MFKKPPPTSQHPESNVTPAFIKNQSFLKRFLARFLSSSQDIEDVVQESYLKALSAEQKQEITCLLYTSPSPRDQRGSRMPSSA